MKRLAAIFALAPIHVVAACTPETIVIAQRELAGDDGGDVDAGSDGDAGGDGDAALAQEDGAQDAEPPPDAALADGGCRTAEECGESGYCQRQRRNDRYGTCAERPTECELTWNPVCGSDNINYFNDCIRKQRGVSFSMIGECQANDSPCDLLTLPECPRGTICGRLRPLPPDDIALFCTLDLLAIPGACWAVPDCSDEPIGALRWVPCELPVPPATFGGASPGGGPGAGGGSFGGGSGGSPGGAGAACVDTCRAITSQAVHILVPPSTCAR